jgi:hypothetical protein
VLDVLCHDDLSFCLGAASAFAPLNFVGPNGLG